MIGVLVWFDDAEQALSFASQTAPLRQACHSLETRLVQPSEVVIGRQRDDDLDHADAYVQLAVHNAEQADKQDAYWAPVRAAQASAYATLALVMLERRKQR